MPFDLCLANLSVFVVNGGDRAVFSSYKILVYSVSSSTLTIYGGDIEPYPSFTFFGRQRVCLDKLEVRTGRTLSPKK